MAKFSVSIRANIIGTQTLCKIIPQYDGKLRLKSFIEPYGHEENHRHQLRSDCNICGPVVIRIVLFIATLLGWFLAETDVKNSF